MSHIVKRLTIKQAELTDIHLAYRLLFARLLVIPMIAVQMTVAHGQSSDCHGVYKTLLNLYAAIVANGTTVFVVRTIVSAQFHVAFSSTFH